MKRTKTKFKVGDIVLIYRYKEDMSFGFAHLMEEWVGKVGRIIEVTSNKGYKDAYKIEAINWEPEDSNWTWDESVIKKLSDKEAFLELI